MDCPCYGCGIRTEVCHAKCDKFLNWDSVHREKREYRRQKIYVEHQADYARRSAIRGYYKMVSKIKERRN